MDSSLESQVELTETMTDLIKLNRKTCYVKNNTQDPDNPKLLETNNEYFCKTPKQLIGLFRKSYKLKNDDIQTVVKMKLIKYRLEVDPKTEEIYIECYVHFLNTLRNLDTWIDYSTIVLDLDKIEFLSENQKNKHVLGNKRKAALAAMNTSHINSTKQSRLNKDNGDNISEMTGSTGPLTFLDSLENPNDQDPKKENATKEEIEVENNKEIRKK